MNRSKPIESSKRVCDTNNHRSLVWLILSVMIQFFSENAFSAQDKLELVCPEGASEDLYLRNTKTGTKRRIVDHKLKAVARKVCSPAEVGGTQTYNTVITNSRSNPIYVNLTDKVGPEQNVKWLDGCTPQSPDGAMIGAQQECHVMVEPCNSQSSNCSARRFCASESGVLNCVQGQDIPATLVEVSYLSADLPTNPCVNTPGGEQGPCVYYNISVIPAGCLDSLWSYSSETGPSCGSKPASYNLPVTMTCENQPLLNCHGPATWGTNNYPGPGSCGDPTAFGTPECNLPGGSPPGGNQSCMMAYFHPTPNPVLGCYSLMSSGVSNKQRKLYIQFLPGN